MVSLPYESILKRLSRIEQRVFSDSNEVNKIDEGLGMFDPLHGGIFGHAHLRFNKDTRNVDWIACSDEEEIEAMRIKYEEFDHKFFGQGEQLSFPDFLECFFYLSPKVPDERKRAVVQKVREQKKSASEVSDTVLT